MAEATTPATQSAATPARTNVRIATLWVAAVALLLAPAAFAFNSGGFFYKPQLFAGIAVFALLGLLAIAAPWPLVERGAPLAALAALAGFTVWTGLSISWSRILGPATDDTDRTVLYCACFALALIVMRDRRIRAVVAGGLAAADEGDPAGPGELADAIGAYGVDEGLDLPFLARDLDHHIAGADIDDAGAEHLNEQ